MATLRIVFQDVRRVDLIKPPSKSNAHLWVLKGFIIFSILSTALFEVSEVFTDAVDASMFCSSAR
jgi:hypothetical protein